MINSLIFKRLDNIEFSKLTMNNVFIFDTIDNLRIFYGEFEKLIKDLNTEDVLYSTINGVKNIDIYECLKCKGFTAIYKINNLQRFIFTLEPMSILTINSIEELWLVSIINNEWDIFKCSDYDNFKNYSSEDIYKFVCASRYGMK